MLKNIFWNNDEQRLRALWRQLVFFLIFIAIFLTGQNTLNMGLKLLNPGTLTPEAFFFAVFFLGELALASAVMLSLWIVARFINREPCALFGFQFNRDWWLDCGVGLLLSFLSTGLIFLIELAAGWITLTGTFTNNLGLPFVLAMPGAFILFILLAFSEETFIRAYPIRNLAQGLNLPGFGPKRALLLMWVLTSVAYGWSDIGDPHATLFGLFNIGLQGILLGMCYILTGSLALSIGLHLGWDFCQGCIFGTPVAGLPVERTVSALRISVHGPAILTGGIFGTDGGLLATVIFLLNIIPVLFYIRWRYGHIRLCTELTRSAHWRAHVVTKDYMREAGSESQTV